jgi:plastocyanin
MYCTTRRPRRTAQTPFAVTAALTALLTAACGGGQPATPPATDAPAAAPAPEPIDPATAGTVSGLIVFKGKAPAPAPIAMDSDPRCMPEGGAAVTETAVVGKGGALQNVFVYVKDGLGDRRFPVPSTPFVFEQKGCTYRPHVFGVQVGQPIEVLNSDAALHNIHALPEANQEFNVGQGQQGARHTHVFSTVEVMVPFKCDVHRWMRAYVGVLDHPFFAVTKADGSFSIAGLPPGTYTIEARHEMFGTQTATVTVGAKETKDIAFAFQG